MADEKYLQFNLKRKVPELHTNYDMCIICQSKTLQPLSGLTHIGYPTLLYAVSNRIDDEASRLAKDMESMDLFFGKHPQYHSECYK